MGRVGTLNGTIKRLVRQRGFGFIAVDQGEDRAEYFFHAEDLIEVQYDDLAEGDRMQFTEGSSKKGLRAQNVTRVQAPVASTARTPGRGSAVVLLLVLGGALLAPPPVPAQALLGPCEATPGSLCQYLSMAIEAPFPRAFTPQDFGVAGPELPAWLELCVGRLAGGVYRYFTNSTAPSPVVGTLVPAAPESPPDSDPSGTLEDDGRTVLLYHRDQIVGFKAIEVYGGTATINWECQRPDGQP